MKRPKQIAAAVLLPLFQPNTTTKAKQKQKVDLKLNLIQIFLIIVKAPDISGGS